MTVRATTIIPLMICLFSSCSMTTYKLIDTGSHPPTNTTFNVKHVLDGCCGCSGILVNAFQQNRLQSQLFVESNQGCPFAWTKFNFHYSAKGTTIKIDTLIAVADSTYRYPITEIDRLAMAKVDSFISISRSSYRLRKIDITGYRHKVAADSNRLMLLPRLAKQALR